MTNVPQMHERSGREGTHAAASGARLYLREAAGNLSKQGRPEQEKLRASPGGAPPSVAPARPGAPSRAARGGVDAAVLVATIGIPLALTVAHLPYDLMSRGERLRSTLHSMLRPSGSLGLARGVIGLGLFLFMWLYPMRKHLPWLSRLGGLAGWRRVHILAGLSLPLLVAVHAGWRFEGLIGLGYLAMVIVCLSGIVGRHLYVRIPRSRGGLELSFDKVAAERRSLLTRIAAVTGLCPASTWWANWEVAG